MGLNCLILKSHTNTTTKSNRLKADVHLVIYTHLVIYYYIYIIFRFIYNIYINYYIQMYILYILYLD